MKRWLAATVALALVPACSKEKREEATPEPAVKPAPVEPAVPAEPAKVPRECHDYSAAILRLAKCNELPDALRAALRETYEVTKVSWAHVTPEGMTMIASACRNAVRTMREASSKCSYEVEYPAFGLEDLPESCQEYAAAVELLASCDKLPEAARDAIRDSYRRSKEAWQSIPIEGKKALDTACKQAADAVKQSAAACN